jgi:acetate kinase
MTQAVLAFNAGSSSLKAALFGLAGEQPLASAQVERIGAAAELTFQRAGTDRVVLPGGPLTDHAAAIARVIELLDTQWPHLQVQAVAHRVVHGGVDFRAPVVVDDGVLQHLERLAPLAPLHQPHNLAGIRAAIAAFPGVPQVACFDTAFHRQQPWVNDTFALPRELHEQGVRRYGFHGLSYEYIAGELARTAPRLHAGCVVVAHLGNGASMCALQAGCAVASTMGFSPLDGLPMGTRCGQIDPGVLLYLLDSRGMTVAEVTDLLYRKSGLLGLSGVSNDMRTLEASSAPAAAQAIDYFVSRCQREVAAMAAVMGGIDALVFSGGIGENSRRVRAGICERLGWMGIEIDQARNAANATVVSADRARTTVMVVPTNEELVMARAARAAARPTPDRQT